MISLIVWSIILACTCAQAEDEAVYTQEVFMGYSDSPDCKQFITEYNKRGEALPYIIGPDNKIPTKILRDLTFPLSVGYSISDTRLKKIEQAPAQTYKFYDITVLEVPMGSQLISSLTTERVYAKFQWLRFVEMDRVMLPAAVDLAMFISNALDLPCVAFAEPPTQRLVSHPENTNAVEHNSADINGFHLPNDPDFEKHQWYLNLMNAPAAWQEWTGPVAPSPPGNTNNFEWTKDQSVVGVTDTGCSVMHQDLIGRFWKNPGEICGNGIDDDHNGYVDDCYGWNFNGHNGNLMEDIVHGTPVSASITANTNNNYGIAGMCWSCKVMCLRIGQVSLSLGAFAEAINYARGFGVKVINFSAGGASSMLEQQALRSAQAADMLVVVAAGNSGCNLDSSHQCLFEGYPARYNIDNVLTVGATGEYDDMASFSNYGRNSVKVFAPGVQIFLPTSQYGQSGFAKVSGTSFSAPLTAGVAILIRSKFPWLTYKQVIQAIVESCRKVDSLSGYAACGGVVDAKRALERAAKF